MNALEQADAGPQLQAFTEGNAFWSLLGTGCRWATSLDLTELTNVKMFLWVYKRQPLGPSWRPYLTAERSTQSFQRSAFEAWADGLNSSHHVPPSRLGSCMFAVPPAKGDLQVLSDLAPASSSHLGHSLPAVSVPVLGLLALPPAQLGLRPLALPVLATGTHFPPGCRRVCTLTSDRGLLRGHVLRGSTTAPPVIPLPQLSFSFTLLYVCPVAT